MKMLLLATSAALALLGNWPAAAADLPQIITKGYVAKRAVFANSTCGWYLGAHTVAENEKLDVAGTVPSGRGTLLAGVGGVTNVGAGVGGTGGYRCGTPTVWYAAEFMGTYRNIGETVMAADPNGVTPAIPASVSGRWGFTERAKLGGPWQTVLNLLPTLGGLLPAQPILPAGATDAQAYLFGALHQDDISGSFAGIQSGTAWRVRVGFGVGTDFAIGTNSNVPMRQDLWVEYIPPSQGITLGLSQGAAATLNTGAEIRIGTAIHFNAGAASLSF